MASILSVLTSRFILNLRLVGTTDGAITTRQLRKPSSDMTAYSMSGGAFSAAAPPASIFEARSILGNIGAPLELEGDRYQHSAAGNPSSDRGNGHRRMLESIEMSVLSSP